MTDHRVLLIEHSAHLSIDTGRLKIARSEQADVFVAPGDIAVLCLHHPAITLSQQALREVAQQGGVVMLTDEQHLPTGMLIPPVGQSRLGLRLRQQIALDGSELAQRLWQQVVQARLRGEAATLRQLKRKGALQLERMVDQVEPGDAKRHEGRAARHYWKHLFPDGFQREKQGATDMVNGSLNYGYSVLRSLVARSLACAGFQCALGIGHYSPENPFNLADDLMEGYRHVVEYHVAEMLDASDGTEFNAAWRKQLLGFVAREVGLPAGDFRLPVAIQETVSSLARVLDSPASTKAGLIFPVM